ncbi:MAG: CBS domain-containing protein [Deltaproteobacteria bacterium]|nr:CBS domain-containing protein [Deltaproteobacteria bacterium]
MKVKDILAKKGRQVITVRETTTVHNAMSIFAANRVGSLLVVDKNDTILGIIAARDVLMAVMKDLQGITEISVDKIMTKDLIVATEDDDIDYIQAVMTENRIRHLPVLDGRELKGLVSIGDVVKALLKAKDVENHYLKDYIADKYPG